MQTITGDLLQDSLLHLLYCALKEEKPALPTDLNWEALLQLANRQQVYNTVLPVLEKAAVLPPEQLQRWNDYRLTELQRTLYVNSQRQAICADLEAQNIRYMFLKGLVLRALYPQTMMRQMSDNDILFDPDRRGDLAKIMREHQFTLTVATDKSDDYYKEPNCLIEFHRELFNHADLQTAFPAALVWQHAVPDPDHPCCYRMSPEDNYLFTLGHMYKHYIMEGCGVRFLCDMYLLRAKQPQMNMKYVQSMVEKMGISSFHQTVIGLAEAVFAGGELTDDGRQLLNDMFSGTVYGKGKTMAEKVDEHGGKGRYILSRLFPKVSIMKNTYPVLEKCPVLLPFYYLVRLFSRLRHRKKEIRSEVRQLKNSKGDRP